VTDVTVSPRNDAAVRHTARPLSDATNQNRTLGLLLTQIQLNAVCCRVSCVAEFGGVRGRSGHVDRTELFRRFNVTAMSEIWCTILGAFGTVFTLGLAAHVSLFGKHRGLSSEKRLCLLDSVPFQSCRLQPIPDAFGRDEGCHEIRKALHESGVRCGHDGLGDGLCRRKRDTRKALTVNGSPLPAGKYTVTWEGRGPGVELKFLKGKNVVATVPAQG
jgi:hypothetical protein